MKDPTKQAEFAELWDDMAGKPKSTIDAETAKEISKKMNEDFLESLKGKSS